jgi:hypothetical protein
MGAVVPETKEKQSLAAPGTISPGAAVEVLAVYAGILLYIWRWQETHPFVWIPLLAAVLFSQWVRGETFEKMGLAGREFRACARLSLPVLGAVIIGAVAYAILRPETAARFATLHAWLSFVGYFVWCAFQQFLTQSYFHRRLMQVIRDPHLRSFAVGLLFAGAHVPNPVLMVATFAGGFIFAEIFCRHPNIWPLAFVQAVAGFLIGTLSPPWIIHNMRVGPGYYLFHMD